LEEGSPALKNCPARHDEDPYSPGLCWFEGVKTEGGGAAAKRRKCLQGKGNLPRDDDGEKEEAEEWWWWWCVCGE